jgi:hypothetical protein
MRQALAKALLADGPHGTPDEARDLPYRERLAQKLVNHRSFSAVCLGQCLGQFCPRRSERNARRTKRLSAIAKPELRVFLHHGRPPFLWRFQSKQRWISFRNQCGI